MKLNTALFSFLFTLIAFSAPADAIFIYDSGEWDGFASITVRWSDERPDELKFIAIGDQGYTFRNANRSRWKCEEVVNWDNFDETSVDADLGRWDKIWGKLRPSHIEEKQKAAVEAAREEYRRQFKQALCTFSFKPLKKIDSDLAEALERGVKQFERFHNIHESTDIGTWTTSWGYRGHLKLFRQLAETEDIGDTGFWVRNADHERIIRCQFEDKFRSHPCWISSLPRS